MRKRLPNRRHGLSVEFEHDGASFLATLGYDPRTGHPAEIFVEGAKPGSAQWATLHDGAVLASLAMQHGAVLADIARSMSRDSGFGQPVAGAPAASAIGAALDAVAELTTAVATSRRGP